MRSSAGRYSMEHMTDDLTKLLREIESNALKVLSYSPGETEPREFLLDGLRESKALAKSVMTLLGRVNDLKAVVDAGA